MGWEVGQRSRKIFEARVLREGGHTGRGSGGAALQML